MSTPTEQCRYCGRTGGDAFTGGPVDVAPGVCPACIDARMAALMWGAAARSLNGEDVKEWMRAEMLELGVTAAWTERFINADIASFAAAGKRLSR